MRETGKAGNAARPGTFSTAAAWWGELATGFVQGMLLLGWGAVLLAPTLLVLRTIFSLAGSQAAAPPPALGEDLALIARMLLAAGGNTLRVSLLAALVSLMLGVPTGLLLARSDLPGRAWWWAGILLLACIPLYVTTSGWVHCFSLAALTATPWRRMVAAGAIMGIAYMPISALFSAIGSLAVPAEVEEAALLSLPGWGVLRHVTLPLMRWAVVGAGTVVFVLAAGEITVCDTLWTRTYAERIYQSFQRCWDARRALLLALPLMLLLGGGILLLGRMLRGGGVSLRAWSRERRCLLRCGRARSLLVLPMLVITGVGIYPLLDLLACAFASGSVRLWPAGGGAVLANSCSLAALGATLAVFLALPVAWWLRDGVRPWRARVIWGVVVALLVLPAPLAGTAMAMAWNQGGAWGRVLGLVGDSAAIVVLLYATRSVPLAVILLWAALRRLPQECIDAARIDGAGGLALLRSVVLPGIYRAVAGVWLLAYVLSLAEVGGVVVLVPAGLPLFAVRFATRIHFGVYPDLARLMLLPPLIILPPVLVWSLWWRERAGEQR